MPILAVYIALHELGNIPVIAREVRHKTQASIGKGMPARAWPKPKESLTKMLNVFMFEPDLLRAAAPAMSKDDARPYLNGVHIACKNGAIVYEATNGHVLVRVNSSLEQDPGTMDFSIIVPAAMVKTLTSKAFIKALGHEEDESQMGRWLKAVIIDKSLKVQARDGNYTQALVEGEFPDTEKVIPTNATFEGKTFEHMGFNIAYIAALARSVRAMTGKTLTAFAPTTQHGPAKFTKECDRGTWLGLLAPAQVDEKVKVKITSEEQAFADQQEEGIAQAATKRPVDHDKESTSAHPEQSNHTIATGNGASNIGD